jgi:hypothetical protein
MPMAVEMTVLDIPRRICVDCIRETGFYGTTIPRIGIIVPLGVIRSCPA